MDDLPRSTVATARVRVWDLPVRVFHWALVLSFGAAYLLAEEDGLRQWHVMFGYTVLGLIAFRLLWGFVGSRCARFKTFPFTPGAALRYLGNILRRAPESHLGHNPAGSYAVLALLLLGLATGVTGYLTLNEVGGEAYEDVHELLANVWLAVIVVHVAGVVLSSVAHRQNLARAMVTGYKRVSSAAPPPDSPSRTTVGVVIATVVLAWWIGSLLTGGPSVGTQAAEEHATHADSTVVDRRDRDDD